MNKRKLNAIALVLSMLMFFSMLAISNIAADPSKPVHVVWCDSNFVPLVPAKEGDYATLFDAVNGVTTGDTVSIVMGAGSRGDSEPVTISQGANIRLNSGGNIMFGGSISVNNSAARLEISNLTVDATGTAVYMRAGELVLNSGATIIGSSNGVLNRDGAIVNFNGGKVSSYLPNGGTTIGTPTLVEAKPTPTPAVSVTGVSISPKEVSLEVSKKAQLTATVSPSNATNKSVTWSSSNTSVAIVSDTGEIRGVTNGSATIRATTVDGSFASTITVNVGSGSSVGTAVTGIYASPTSVSIQKGNTAQIYANVTPSTATNQQLTWSSSNTSIATVSSSGLITARATGTVYVTVRTAEKGYTARISVRVTDAPSTPTPAPTPPKSVSTDIARSTNLYLDGKKASGTAARSKTYVAIQPKNASAAQRNKMTVSVRAFNRLGEDNYSTLRYRLPWIQIDAYSGMAIGMDRTDRLDLTASRLSNTTMSSAMNAKWRAYSAKNINGPWEISSNSDERQLQLRILLPKLMYKNQVRLLRWTGTTFVTMNSADYAVIKIGTQYFVRSNKVEPGTYAVTAR